MALDPNPSAAQAADASAIKEEAAARSGMMEGQEEGKGGPAIKIEPDSLDLTLKDSKGKPKPSCSPQRAYRGRITALIGKLNDLLVKPALSQAKGKKAKDLSKRPRNVIIRHCIHVLERIRLDQQAEQLMEEIKKRDALRQKGLPVPDSAVSRQPSQTAHDSHASGLVAHAAAQQAAQVAAAANPLLQFQGQQAALLQAAMANPLSQLQQPAEVSAQVSDLLPASNPLSGHGLVPMVNPLQSAESLLAPGLLQQSMATQNPLQRAMLANELIRLGTLLQSPPTPTPTTPSAHAAQFAQMQPAAPAMKLPGSLSPQNSAMNLQQKLGFNSGLPSTDLASAQPTLGVPAQELGFGGAASQAMNSQLLGLLMAQNSALSTVGSAHPSIPSVTVTTSEPRTGGH